MGQISIVPSDARKALDAEKFRENGIKKSVWLGDVLWTEFVHGQVTRFDRRLTSVKIRQRAEIHGFDQKLGDCCAVEIAKFPDRKARAAEGFRRMAELIEHLEGGGDDWSPARKAAVAYVPTEDDVFEVLVALYGDDKADALWPGIVKMHPGTDGAEVDAKAALGFLTSSKEGARAWAGIQAERRKTDAAPGAEDLLAQMMAAAGADGEGADESGEEA